MWFQFKENVLHLNSKIKPNAKQTAVISIEEDYLKVSTHALPVGGAANKEPDNISDYSDTNVGIVLTIPECMSEWSDGKISKTSHFAGFAT
jgi:hypothetical protein